MAAALMRALSACAVVAVVAAASLRRAAVSTQRPGLPVTGDFAGGNFAALGLRANKLPSLALLKTHKTGSSTLANIMHRLGDRRNMSFMVPPDNVHLGWPRKFPGSGALEKYGPPRHQFDIIANHAVFDNAGFRGYLKGRDPHFVVVARDPMTQAISAKDYFHQKSTHWDDHLDWLEGLNPLKDFHACTDEQIDRSERKCDTQIAHFLNPQAHDMGWHSFAKRAGAHSEGDRALADEWFRTLEDDLKPSSSIILAEYFDEGLVLMRQKLGCDLQELSYLRMKVKKRHKAQPTKSQLQRLAQVNAVDVALYSHLNHTFWEEWKASDLAVLQSELADIRRMNAALVVACDEFDWDKKRCPQAFVTDEVKYGVALKKKQRDWGLTLDE